MITIRNVKTILTAPAGINLVVVKVETSEPELYGIGCATFTQRYMAVKAAIDEHLAHLVVGRDVARIEELQQLSMVHSYWRNGPVLNNAISGVDQALWDIKGKLAGMPLYDLLGGKMREGAAVYRHADGPSLDIIEERARAFVEAGVRHVRIQAGGYGGAACEGLAPPGSQAGAYYHPRRYTRDAIAALEHIRNALGDDTELLHDVHERLKPAEAVEFAKEVEPLRLYFLEDLLAPEDNDWFENVRAVCATPLAMGELFCHPREWMPLIEKRLIDFVRMHISTMGGLTPARKVAAASELFGIRTAWHGPGDVSPVGHAVNVHLDLVSPNFGIQEWSGMSDPLGDVFPGLPELRGGYAYVSDRPGHGVDIDEEAAAKYPHQPRVDTWSQARLPDGSIARP
jgi:mannonate dehydratase